MAVAAPVMIGMAVAGAGMKAVGTLTQGAAAQNAANYQAQVARNNATIARQQAEYSTAAGMTQAETASRKSAAIGGKIKTAQAASGIDVNTGSAVDVQVGQRMTGQLDTETTLNNALLQAYGYRAKATEYEAEADLSEMKGKSAKIGSYFEAAGNLLSDASSIGGKFK